MTEKEFESFKASLKEFQDTNNKLEVRIALLELKIDQLTKSLDSVAASMSWLPKTVGTILVGAILAVIFKMSGGTGVGQ